jgi:hypothetical protein
MLIYQDPTAAAAIIAHAAVPPAPPVSVWRTIRREMLIGLAWGSAIAMFVIYPLKVKGAYRDAAGRIVQNYTGGHFAAFGEVPVRFDLEWSEWFVLFVQECGPIFAIPGLIGLLVGLLKVFLGRPRKATPGDLPDLARD